MYEEMNRLIMFSRRGRDLLMDIFDFKDRRTDENIALRETDMRDNM